MRGPSRIFWWVPLTVVLTAFAIVVAYGLSVGSASSAVAGGPVASALSSDSCTNCHDMEGAISSWSHSSHSDVACTACHVEITPENYIDQQVRYVQMRLGRGHNPMAVTDERCTSCHAPQMPWVMEDQKPPTLLSDGTIDEAGYTPTPLNVVAGHDLHLKGNNPLQCIDCHAVEGHESEPADSTLQAATNAGLRASIMHQACNECHVKENVVVTVDSADVCASCHRDPEEVEPADHLIDWPSQHGDAALQGDAKCTQCHISTDFQEPGVSTLFWSQVTSNRDFCADCHGMEMPHPAGWMQDHPAEYQKNAEACVSCHGTEPGVFGGKPLVTASELVDYGICESCHGVDLPHPEGWLQSHGPMALEKPDTCDTCHSGSNPVAGSADYASDTFCIDCHGLPMPHPESFGTQHDNIARENPAQCTNCHSAQPSKTASLSQVMTQRFCLNCHQQKFEHPDLWVLNHGTVVEDNGTASCQTCHTSESYCETCHKGEEWHPEGWTISHRWAIRNGEVEVESCLTCHPTKQPCLKCHADEPDDFFTRPR